MTIGQIVSHLVAALLGAFAMIFAIYLRKRAAYASRSVPHLIQTHFAPVSPEKLRVSERRFPIHIRADVQRTIDALFKDQACVRRFTGFRKRYAFQGVSFADLLDEQDPAVATAPEYEDVDIGEESPVRCLKDGLWFVERDGQRYALFLAQVHEPCGPAFLRLQTVTLDDERGAAVSDEFFHRVENAVAQAGCYRGKILSFEVKESYRGEASGVTVHKLRTVERHDVILPGPTLELLDRNLLRFVRQRPQLAALRLPTKKGLLFYGPPGTGKTHTIHYLAKALAGHTTLLISAEQVQHISHYMTLARLLQPSLVVIEDVDLIARDQADMRNPMEEVLLNKLLNEMDGLREDADILFVLTTNRPETLEAAVASRPGRIDQAIEFPLPDEDGRCKLVRLYGCGLELSDEVVRQVAARTDRVSAAFIKELMRRSAQFHLESNGSTALAWRDVELALDEMLFRGGALNLKLLGADIGPNRER